MTVIPQSERILYAFIYPENALFLPLFSLTQVDPNCGETHTIIIPMLFVGRLCAALRQGARELKAASLTPEGQP